MSTLFGSQGSQANATPHETALNVQSSCAGKVVPVVLGTKRMAGNLVWYGDFRSKSHKSSSEAGKNSSDGGSVSYTYTASMIFGLCTRLRNIGKIWVLDDEVAASKVGISFRVASGAPGQSPWSYLTNKYPDQALSYAGLGYVAIAHADLGSSSSLKAWNWEVRGLGTPVNTDASGSYDISFAEAIRLIIEDTSWGCGLTGVMADLTDYTGWCAAHGFALSVAISDAKSAREMIQEFTKATLSEAVWSGDRLKIVPYADQTVGDYRPDLTPVLIVDATMLRPAGSDDETPIKIHRKDVSEFSNHLSVEYEDRDNDYNVATVTATDDGHIATYGLRPGNAISAHFLSTAAAAQHVADLVQGRELAITAEYEFGLGPVGVFVEPMDILWLNEPLQGMTNYPVRVKEISEDDPFSFSVIAEDIPGIIGAMTSRPVAVGSGYRSGLNVAPTGACNSPILFEPPYELVTSVTGLEVWLAISSRDEAWGGCQIWASTDGDTYAMVGTVDGNARTGRLTAALPNHADPDSTSALAVDLSESGATLLSGTQTDADRWVTLCYCDGELIAYQTATLTGTGQYRLNYLRRGAYRTTIKAHPSGAAFARLDRGIFKYPYTADMIGSVISFKILGTNHHGGGVQDIFDAEVYSYTITGRAPPPDPDNLFLSGESVVWEQSLVPQDMTGWRVRHISGVLRSWEDGADYPADGSVVTVQSIPLSALGTGKRTIMVRAIDSCGTLSAGTRYLTVGVGDPAPDNVILRHDFRALGWPGTFLNGIIEDGDLKSTLKSQSGSESIYDGLRYDTSFLPDYPDVPARLILDYQVSGEGWAVYYRRHNTSQYLPRRREAYLADDDAPYLGQMTPWMPWPGALNIGVEYIYLRVRTLTGDDRGEISTLVFLNDVPDIVESFEDIPIAVTGSHVPITKAYRRIDYVGAIAIQDDGRGAVSIVIANKDSVRGPLLYALDATGANCTATIDIRELKGH